MIQFNNLRKTYGQVTALESITGTISDGEIFGLIGPDGAGKTTLFRILASLLLADSGEAVLNNLDVVKDYKTIRNIVGYMPGRFSLYTDLSVIENLTFYATVFGTTLEENYSLIKDIYTQIEPFKNRLAGRLSGGMKQKLALSCALIHRPEILILDEPTTGVDAVSRMEFWELLKNLKKYGITILVSTPYMDEAGLCDRISLIHKGKILKTDTPESLKKSYKGELYSIKSNENNRLLKELDSYSYTNSALPFGQSIHFSPRGAGFNQRNLNTYLIEKGFKNLEIESIIPSVEDVFIDLIREEKAKNKQAV